ncbi:hypothetical protein ACO0RG_001431 [Hanseniaspora osmophila]
MVSNELRRKALSAYKEALRATNIVFKHDEQLLQKSRTLIRTGMTDPTLLYAQFPKIPKDNAEEQIQHLLDVSNFLKSNIVQGTSKKTGTDVSDSKNNKSVQKDTNGELPVYHLNIHKHTELGDNESINDPPKGTLKVGNVSGGCCGGRR